MQIIVFCVKSNEYRVVSRFWAFKIRTILFIVKKRHRGFPDDASHRYYRFY